jgi:hypothetical protein
MQLYSSHNLASIELLSCLPDLDGIGIDLARPHLAEHSIAFDHSITLKFDPYWNHKQEIDSHSFRRIGPSLDFDLPYKLLVIQELY